MSEHRLLCAEDLTVGEELDLGEYLVTGREILDFAGHWDPQPFHINEDFAARGYFGGIIASGVHTLGVFQRLAVLGAYRNWDLIAGRAIRDIQLLRPVRPGTLLRGSLTVQRVSLTHPDRALVTKVGKLTEDGLTTLTVELDAYVRRRQLSGDAGLLGRTGI